MKMKEIAIPALVLLGLLLLGLLFSVRVWAGIREAEVEETRVQLSIMAETTLSNSENWEPVVSEDKYVDPDSWGTEIRLLYAKLPSMSIVVCASAGPNCIWGDHDDMAESAFVPETKE